MQISSSNYREITGKKRKEKESKWKKQIVAIVEQGLETHR